METAIASFCGLCILLLLGKYLRVKFRFIQKLYLPSSVIGGLIGLLLVQILLRFANRDAGGNLTGEGAVSEFLAMWTSGWGAIPGIFINVVFAALFLGVAIPPLSVIWKRAGTQLAYGQIVAWGQYVVGVGLALIICRPLFNTEGIFGVIVPVGFEGGHGTAGGLKATFEDIGQPALYDYALTSATFGLILSIGFGIALVNWAVRKGHVKKLRPISSMTEQELAGIYPVDQRPEAGRQTVSSDSVDSLALHLAIIGIAILIGFLGKNALIAIDSSFRDPSLNTVVFEYKKDNETVQVTGKGTTRSADGIQEAWTRVEAKSQVDASAITRVLTEWDPTTQDEEFIGATFPETVKVRSKYERPATEEGWDKALAAAAKDKTLMKSFPLFPLCMLGGLVVQIFLQRSTKNSPVDHQLMQRAAGTALDFLVVAAIANIRVEVVAENFAPFIIVVLGGLAWNIFCVMWLAPRLLSSDWFERAIAEMGQSMGVTATGLLLLRVVDPNNETDAPSAFGYKQLLHEPFMGGGIWTSAAIIIFITQGAFTVLGISMAAVAIWLLVWYFVLRPQMK